MSNLCSHPRCTNYIRTPLEVDCGYCFLCQNEPVVKVNILIKKGRVKISNHNKKLIRDFNLLGRYRLAVMYCDKCDEHVDIDKNDEHFVGSDMECRDSLIEKLKDMLCMTCNGSGEGYTDGSRCNSCKGKGSAHTDDSITDYLETL